MKNLVKFSRTSPTPHAQGISFGEQTYPFYSDYAVCPYLFNGKIRLLKYLPAQIAISPEAMSGTRAVPLLCHIPRVLTEWVGETFCFKGMAVEKFD